MNKNYYDINFDKITQWFLPYEVKKDRLLAFIASMLAPLKTLYNEIILAYREQLLKEINLRSQKQLLEYYLNQRIYGGGSLIFFNNVDPFPINNPYLWGYDNDNGKLIGYSDDDCEYEEYDSVTFDFNTWDYVLYYPVSMPVSKLNEIIAITKKVAFIGSKIKTQTY